MSIDAINPGIQLTRHAVGSKGKSRLSPDRTPLLEMQSLSDRDTFESQMYNETVTELLAPLLRHAETTSERETHTGKPFGLKRTTSIPSELDLLVQAAEETEGSLAEDWVQVDLDGNDLGSKPKDSRLGSKSKKIGRFEITEEEDSLLEDELVELEAMRPSTPAPTSERKLIAPTPRRPSGPTTWALETLASVSDATRKSAPPTTRSTDIFGSPAREQSTDFDPGKEFELFCSELPFPPSWSQAQSARTPAVTAPDITSMFEADVESLPERSVSPTESESSMGQAPLRRSASAGAILNTEMVALPTQEKLLEILGVPYQVKLFTTHEAKSPASLNSVASQLRTANPVALGDLHGSYSKLVETLVAADMVTMPEDVAKEFADLAKHPDNFSHSAPRLSAHNDKLMRLVPFMRWKGGDRKLLLAGDVIGDRGPFDQVTLAIVRNITRNHPERIIRIASNHDHNVLRYMTYGVNGIDGSCTNSLQQSYKIANYQNKLPSLQKRYFNYLAQSKLIQYDPGSKTMYTHAPVTKRHVQQLIHLLAAKSEAYHLGDVPKYDAIRTPEEMTRFVEQVNRFYSQYVKNAARTKTLDLEVENILIGETEANGFLWSRSPLKNEDDLPFKENGVVARLVHGHDQQSQTSPFSIEQGGGSGYQIVNLDQDARKYDSVKALGEETFGKFCEDNASTLKLDSRLYIQ